MHKTLALALLGGNCSTAAREVGLTYQAVSQWPDHLSDVHIARVTQALAWKHARGTMLDLGLRPPEFAIAVQLRDP